MKKFLLILLSFVMGLFVLVSCAPQETEKPDYKVEYTITYQIVVDGEKQDVPDAMKKAGGKYPVSYIKGEGAEIDDLVNMTMANATYSFGGWYFNVECTDKCTGISKENIGNVTLYAKIVVIPNESTPPAGGEETGVAIAYKAVIDGTEADVPTGMFKTLGKYPATYESETGLATDGVDVLQEAAKDEYSFYKFEGWYLEKECTTPFAGIAVGSTEKVTLYAKVSVKNVEYQITYKAVINGTEGDILNGMWKQNGKYPTTYTKKDGLKTTELDDLKSYTDSGYEYTFKGWYLDKECTQKFAGIPAGNAANVPLFAKYEKVKEDINNDGSWTKNY